MSIDVCVAARVTLMMGDFRFRVGDEKKVYGWKWWVNMHRRKKKPPLTPVFHCELCTCVCSSGGELSVLESSNCSLRTEFARKLEAACDIQANGRRERHTSSQPLGLAWEREFLWEEATAAYKSRQHTFERTQWQTHFHGYLPRAVSPLLKGKLSNYSSSGHRSHER